MKVTEHVEQLLRQGRKRKELIELGFPKRVVTRVYRKLKDGKTTSQPGSQKGKVELNSHPQPAATPVETASVQPKLGALDNKVQQLESRVEVLEAMKAELDDVETHINGTPALGLKHRFKCSCGASGFVALHIQCTKCGRETWWGWFPE
jgi:ribosomal protein S27AE